jgi:hypothetical protein
MINDIIHTCSKCGYSEYNIKLLKDHVSDCSGNLTLEKNCYSLLMEKLKYEMLKSSMYHNIIINNTNIKIENTFTDIGNIGIVDRNIDKNDKMNTISFYINDNQHLLNIDNTSKRVKKNVYRTMKSVSNNQSNNQHSNQHDGHTDIMSNDSYDICDDNNIDHTMHTINTNHTMHTINTNHTMHSVMHNKNDTDINVDNERSKNIEECFDKIKTCKPTMYTRILNDLKSIRMKYLDECNTMPEYTKYLISQVHDIETLLNDKKYSVKKIKQIIIKGLSSLETRLLSYPGYRDIQISGDDINIFEKFILKDVKARTCNNNIFDKTIITHVLSTFSCSLFTLDKLINMTIVSTNNLIYIDDKTKNIKNENDPYKYYFLTKKECDVKYWNMDARLEELTEYIITNGLPHMISLFRKIYYDVFGDNDFRQDYITKSVVMEFECEQLLINIFTICNKKIFNIFLRKYIKEKCVYSSTINDKFNTQHDDNSQRLRFKSMVDETDMIAISKKLFNDISIKDSIKFYESKNIPSYSFP